MHTHLDPSRADDEAEADDSFDDLMKRGIGASRANDSALAVRCFQRASALLPTDGAPCYLAAAELADTGDIASAESAFADAVRLAPDFVMARFQLGLLQFTSGRSAMALLTWEPLRALPETSPLPHFIGGFIALGMHDFDEAVRCLERGLPLNDDNPPLSADVRQLIATIVRLQPPRSRRNTEADEPVASAADVGTVDVTRHVLLSAYRPSGDPH